MSKWEENSVLIERYLDNDLSEVEKIAFEKQLAEDEKLSSDLAFQKQIRKDIRLAGERNEMKNKLNDYHQTYFSHPGSTESKVISIRRRSVVSIVSIAATISLIITVGSIAIYHFGIEQKLAQKDYVETDRSIDNEKASAAPAVEENKDVSSEKNESIIDDFSTKAATAFALTSDGWVISSYHTVKDSKVVKLEMVGDSLKSYKAEVRFYNKKLDIAFIKITDSRFKSLGTLPYSFNKSEEKLAEKIFTLGYPKDDIVFTEGSISSLTGYNSDSLAYQAGISINPGNSGAPLFNQNGEIIGVIAGKHGKQDGTAYAIKSSYFIKTLDHLKLQEGENPLQLPARNLLKGKKVTDQVKMIMPYVFIIKA